MSTVRTVALQPAARAALDAAFPEVAHADHPGDVGGAQLVVVDARAFDACPWIARLRSEGFGGWVLAATRPTAEHAAEVLRSGADDVVLADAELVLRARAQLGRTSPGLQLDFAHVDLTDGAVERQDGTTARLTRTETRLLAYLSARPDRAVSRATLLREVWDYAPTTHSRTVAVTMTRLRAKVEADPRQPRHLLTAFGVGYRFRPPTLAPTDPDFIGRRAALAALDDAVDAGIVVTVVGTAGVGKTRLVQHWARRWDGRTVEVALQPTRTRDDVVIAVAGSLGINVGEVTEAVEAQVGRALAIEPTLLMLDNAEHVADELDALVRTWTSPPVRCVVTSRRPLRDEPVIELAPLPSEDALQLFRVRARRHGSTDEAWFAAIVSTLDGLPLEIELAADRLRVLAPEQLHRRLAADAVYENALDRAIHASWELLDDAGRAALAQCSVFEASFSPSIAEQVLVLPDDTPVLDVLETLVDQSLLVAADGRLRLLESIRAFARRRVTDDGLAVRHARACASWAAQVHDELDWQEALRVLLAELPDLRAAIEHGPDDAIADIAIALETPLLRAGRISVGTTVADGGVAAAERLGDPERLAGCLRFRAQTHVRRLQSAAAEADLRRALELSPSTLWRARTVCDLAMLLLHVDRMDEADALLKDASASIQQLGDADVATARVATVVARHRAILARRSGRLERGLAFAAESQAHARTAGDDALLAQALSAQAVIQRSRHFVVEAADLHREVVELVRRQGDLNNLAIALGNLVNALVLSGEIDEAERVCDEGEQLNARLGHAHTRTFLALARMSVSAAQGDVARAERKANEALVGFRTMGNRVGEQVALAHLGRVHHQAGDPKRALLRYDEALEIPRRRPEIVALRAAALADLGDVEAARAALAEHADAYASAHPGDGAAIAARFARGLLADDADVVALRALLGGPDFNRICT